MQQSFARVGQKAYSSLAHFNSSALQMLTFIMVFLTIAWTKPYG